MSAPSLPHPRPGITRDNAFFWEGVSQRELRIQSCADCGKLLHPPGPACPECHSFARSFVRARGRGTVHSYVVAHHPPIPLFEYPNPIALIELEEGTRLVSRLVDVDPDDVRIGMPVEVDFETVDDDLVLHCFRPAGRGD